MIYVYLVGDVPAQRAVGAALLDQRVEEAEAEEHLPEGLYIYIHSYIHTHIYIYIYTLSLSIYICICTYICICVYIRVDGTRRA